MANYYDWDLIQKNDWDFIKKNDWEILSLGM
ncbi:hypothetical protein b3_0050 [Synechococcus phage B3]|jgi:hypothetical protein|nr:hypothetical protein b3_0050 [Synechococcus phage B3]QGT54678.1 hypothetical protein b23_0050 [Synechococcus phage B23]